MAKITIGGKEYTVPEMNFLAVERAWPHIQLAMIADDPIQGAGYSINVIAAGIVEAEDFNRAQFDLAESEILTPDEVFTYVAQFLKRKLKAKEMDALAPCVNQIADEAGLQREKTEGEDDVVKEEANPSPEIAQNSSSSSSQPAVKEEAGTA